MQVYSTEAAPPGDRFAYWREVLTQQFIHLRPERTERRAFFGAVRTHAFGGSSFSEVRAASQRVHRGRSEIARSPFDLTFLNLHLGGGGSYRQAGEETPLRPGDLFLIDATRPFALGCDEPIRQISVKLHWALLRQMQCNPDDLAGCLIRGDSYVGKLLGSYVATQWRACQAGEARELEVNDGETVNDHLAQLVDYDITRRRTKARLPRPAIHAGIYAQALRHIERHAALPTMTPHEVAAALGVSLRTLQSIFEHRQNSISRQIQRSRLETAAGMLRSPDHRHKAIGEIAFEAGFSDLSHFTHAFVRAFDATPGAWRKQD